MLRTMRSNLKSLSWTLWLVIIAFIGFIFVEWGAGRLSPIDTESDLLSVGNKVIKGEVFHHQLARTLERYRRQFKKNLNKAFITQMRIPEQILQNLIYSTIIQLEAKKYDLKVSKDEIRDKIIAFPDFQRDGKFIGSEAYKKVVPTYYHMTIKEFEENLEKDIVVEKVKELVAGTLVIDGDTLWNMYKKEKDKAELDYISFDLKEIKKNIATSEDEQREYYNQHKEAFKTPEKRSAHLMVYRFDDFKKEIAIEEQEIYDYFDSKKTQFIIPGKTKVFRIFLKYTEKDREDVLNKADNLRNELKPDNFSENAKILSQDDKAKDGGDWGYWEWKRFTTQELSIIERLQENEISTPIDTGAGFSIIFIAEQVAERQETYSEVKTRIRETLEKQKCRDLVMEKIEKVYKDLKGVEDIQSFAKSKGLGIIDTGFVTSGQAIKDVDEVGHVSRRLFSLDEKEIAPPFEFHKGFTIAQLKKIVPPEVEAYDVAKEKVKELLQQEKKLNLLVKEAERVTQQLNKISGEKEVERYLKKKNLKVENLVYKIGNKFSYFPYLRGLDDRIFSSLIGVYSKPVQFEKEVVIYKVKSKTITTENDFKVDKQDFYNQSIEKMKNDFFASYIMNKQDRYKVRINQKLFEKITEYLTSRFQ